MSATETKYNLQEISLFLKKIAREQYHVDMAGLSDQPALNEIIEALSVLAKAHRSNSQVLPGNKNQISGKFLNQHIENQIIETLIQIVNQSKNKALFIQKITDYLHQISGCKAIAIRIKTGNEFVLTQSKGFSKKYLLDEKQLCIAQITENHQNKGNQPLNTVCLCGRVIQKNYEQNNVSRTRKGSVWVNNSALLYNSASPQKPALPCVMHGYKSLAIIAIKSGKKNIGTIQLADHEPDRFNAETLILWEQLAEKLAIAFTRFIAQEALEKSEARLRSTLDNMMEGCQIISPDYRYLYVNKAVARQAKVKPGKLLGHKMTDAFPGIDKTDLFAKIEACMQTGQAFRYENRFVFPDKTQGWFELNMQRIPEGVFILSIDITQRKTAEEALAQSENKFRYIFDNSTEGKSLTQPDGTLTVNKAFCKMLGYSQSQMKKLNWRQITHPDDIEESERQVKMMKEGKVDSFRQTKRYLHKNGAVVWTIVTAALRRDEKGNPMHFITSMHNITDLVLANEKLKNSRETLKQFVDHTPAGIAMFDKEMRFIANNKRFYKDYNLKQNNLIGKSYYEVFPETPPSLKEMHQKCMGGIIQRAHEEPISRKDGSTDYIRWEMCPWYKTTTEIGGIILFSEVVSEQVSNKAKLDASYKQLETLHRIDKALLEARSPVEIATFALRDLRLLIPDFDRISVTELDAETETVSLLAVNPSDKTNTVVVKSPLREIPGYKKLLKGQTVLVKKMGKNALHNPITKKLVEKGMMSYAIFPLKAENQLVGTLNLVHSRPIVITDELIGLLEKVTGQMAIVLRQSQLLKQVKQINEELENRVKDRTRALEQSEKKYRQLFEQAPDSILLINSRTKQFDEFNTRAYKTLGYTRKEFAKLRVEDIEYFENSQEINQRMKKVLDMGTANFETIHLHKTGKKINVNVKVSVFETGGDKYFQTIWTDITALKKKEQAIQQLNNELKKQQWALQESVAELESFAYSVSHDLRTPLRAINGYTKLLIDDYASCLDEEAIRISNVIRKNAIKMGQLIDDLLSFSRMRRKEMSTQHIHMTAIAKSVYHELSETLDKKRITCIIHRLPPIKGDKNMIRQVWVNLLSNAIKFTKYCEHALIEIDAKTTRDSVTYSIKDNGAGFDMKYLKNLFGVFQRLHSQRLYEGTGVGLALVKRIIQRHNGSVGAKSEANNGATFYFTLPKHPYHKQS